MMTPVCFDMLCSDSVTEYHATGVLATFVLYERYAGRRDGIRRAVARFGWLYAIRWLVANKTMRFRCDEHAMMNMR